jgi:hypothetical protein
MTEEEVVKNLLTEVRKLRQLLGILAAAFVFVFYLLNQMADDIRLKTAQVTNLKAARSSIEERLDKLEDKGETDE